MLELEKIIEKAWLERENISSATSPLIHDAVESVMALLDVGQLRVAEKKEGNWQTCHWIKKAILLSFRLRENQLFTWGAGCTSKEEMTWFDKVPLKCHGWKKEDFQKAGFRFVPGAIARFSAYIAEDVVVMPSFINVGAYIGCNTMIDTWATIGSCAQIGKNCHISGGVGIGGVLEPLQSNPVIIEDNCFIGARSEIAEGVLIEEGSVIAMGVFISASTKIVNRATGKISFGHIPPYSVVVPGTLPSSDAHGPSLACAVIVKQVDAQTRAKTGINDLLRA